MTTKSPAKPKKPVPAEQKKIDRQIEDSFPASDPPSYAGGNHIIGEPPRPDKVPK
jgi:hypothetical protein